jgi:poly-beta-1,6-N-acetyl-D-glucosamine synthase
VNTASPQESVTCRPVVNFDPQRIAKSGGSRPKYVVISPVRDEGELIARTIESVARQSVVPTQWIIVNDGSKDNTGAVIDQYARKHSWITAVHRADRGFRQPGTGVIDAFYTGYEFIEVPDWEFIVKLDGDLILGEDYFKNCLAEFRENPKLGIGGGAVGHMVNGAMYIERTPSFHVRGATKIYRRDCWDAIGGLLKAPGWDTIDELKANMLGWSTRSFQHLPLLQARPTGATNGIWGNSVKNGRANYITGYHPLFMLLKCLGRARKKPYVVAGLGMMYGYMHGYFTNVPRVEDEALIRYTREQQLRKLLLRDSIWQ